MVDHAPHAPVAGFHVDDIARFDQALTGVRYPVSKWELIAHAGAHPVGRRTDPRTIRQLCALPTGLYTDLTQVLSGAARTARGHPLRTCIEPRYYQRVLALAIGYRRDRQTRVKRREAPP